MWIARLVLVGSLVACAAPERGDSRAPASTHGAATWSQLDGDPRVGRYVSSPWSFSTVSYWIEGDDGVVLVDTQFLPSSARELKEVAERETGKPVVAAIVLHANPDKFNGTAVLQEQGVVVLTSAQVLALIPDVHAKRIAAFGERYRPDYPLEAAAPTSFGDRDATIERAGLRLDLRVLGPGCSAAHVALAWEGHLFVGDLVASGAHSWLELGLGDEWRQRIDELTALRPSHVHPGRGASGGPELLEAQGEYLRRVDALVSEQHSKLHDGGNTPTREQVDHALAEVKATLVREHPDYAFAVFLAIGLPAEWRRIDAARRSP